jgi:hypothetical protein
LGYAIGEMAGLVAMYAFHHDATTIPSIIGLAMA